MWYGSFLFYSLIFGVVVFAVRQYELSINRGFVLTDTKRKKWVIRINAKTLPWEFLTTSLLILLAGLRGIDVGADTISYYNIFEEIKRYSIIEYMPMHLANTSVVSGLRIEFGFQILNHVSYLIADSYNLFLTICESICVLFVWKGIKYYHIKYGISIPLMMYFYLMFEYFHTYNVIRFSLGVALVFYAYRYVIEKKYIHYIVYVLLAASIHKISLFCLGFILFNFLERGFLRKYGVWIIGIALALIIPNLNRLLTLIRGIGLFAYEGGYTLQANQNKIISATLYSIIFFAPLVIKYKEWYKNFDNAVPIFGISIMYLPLNLLAYYNFFFTRLSRFGMLLMCVLICKFLKEKKSIINIPLWEAYYTVFALAAHIFEVYISDGPGIYPYALFFH